jgi:pyruvate/2-oxoglutarate dehydrogenase complex dihydrolipoamide acyltransferase (E2) component
MTMLDVRVDPGASEDMEILRVVAGQGTVVAAGDLLVEVGLDKVNVEVVAPAAGRVVEVCGSVGSILRPDAVLVRIETS